MSIPTIDPTVQHVTLGQFRKTTSDDLARLTYVVRDGAGPVAVCVPYTTFFAMQNAIGASHADAARRG